VLQPEQYEAGTKIPVAKAGIPEKWRGRNTEWQGWRERNAVIAVIAAIAGNYRGASVIVARFEVSKIVESHDKS
jgi:hypothetical protein